MEASRKKVVVEAGGSEEVGLAVMKASGGKGNLWPLAGLSGGNFS